MKGYLDNSTDGVDILLFIFTPTSFSFLSFLKMSLPNEAIVLAIDAYRKYYDSVLLNYAADIRRAALTEAINATLRCSPEDQKVVEKQSVEDMDEATRCFEEDFDHDEAKDHIRLIRKARASFDVRLCEGRLDAVLAANK